MDLSHPLLKQFKFVAMMRYTGNPKSSIPLMARSSLMNVCTLCEYIPLHDSKGLVAFGNAGLQVHKVSLESGRTFLKNNLTFFKQVLRIYRIQDLGVWMFQVFLMVRDCTTAQGLCKSAI